MLPRALMSLIENAVSMAMTAHPTTENIQAKLGRLGYQSDNWHKFLCPHRSNRYRRARFKDRSICGYDECSPDALSNFVRCRTSSPLTSELLNLDDGCYNAAPRADTLGARSRCT